MFIETVSRHEPCCLAQRNLDGGLIEGKYTGSYSTRRGGMITTGCPGSSPRTPEGQRGESEYKESLGTAPKHSDS